MAITDAYADNAKYKAIIGASSGDSDTEVDAQLIATSRYLEVKLNRFFTRDVAAVARVYYPPGYFTGDPDSENPWLGSRSTRDLRVDDIATTTGLVIKIDDNQNGLFTDSTALAATDYELRPLNANLGPEAKPWNTIRLTRWGTRSVWPNGCAVQVTASFGWPAVPEAIAQATCQLTAILRLEGGRSTNQIASGFDAILGTSREAQDIVEKLQRVYAKRWVFA